MASNYDDLQQFRRLKAQAAQKKQLEARRAELLPQCQALSVQAEARKKERLDAERELAGLESKGPLGLLYTIAGGKAQRLEDARKALRAAKTDDQQASWALAEAQASLAQTERELDALTGLEDSFAAARQARSEALRAAGLPQSQQLLILEGGLAHETGLVQAITDLCAQCRAALEAAQKTLRLAERAEQWRTPSTTELLQYTAAQTVQFQQTLEQGLTGLLDQVEGERLRLEDAQDDLLAQDLPFGPGAETDPL